MPSKHKITLLKSKLHRARVTDANLEYEGSLSIDRKWMEDVGLLEFEKILIGNITNGNRFETYAIPAPYGSNEICLNGAVAHLGKVGDILVIMSFAQLDVEDAGTWKPNVVNLENERARLEGV